MASNPNEIRLNDRVVATSHKGQPHGVVDKIFEHGDNSCYGGSDKGRLVAHVTYDNGADSFRWIEDLVREETS